jgi:DNA-binding MarR family transcriptional regulator
MYWSQYNIDRGFVQVRREVRNGEPDEDGVHIRIVMDALRRIVRTLRISARASEARLGISSAQVFVLHQLAKQDASSIDELAERTLTHQSSVSAVVGRLAARGLVTRRTAPDDARRTRISLTAAGRALLMIAPEVSQARLIAALERLRPSRQLALARDLTALVRALEVSGDPPAMFFEDDARARRRRSTLPAASERNV